MYHIRILDSAVHDLSKLDGQVGRRVVNRIRWLAENIESIGLESLAGDLAGLYKLRVGDYRILYEILYNEKAIVVHIIGHRREVYRGR
jgi:mRNA interferase RelE/StbE